jgi:hypothetical protein
LKKWKIGEGKKIEVNEVKANEFIRLTKKSLNKKLTKGESMLPPSVITGAVVGGIYGALNASSKGITYPSEIAGWATPYLILGAILGFVLHILFFRNKKNDE